jgi:hypothetical protein
LEDSTKIVRIHQGLYAEQVLEAILVKLKDSIGCENGGKDCPAVNMIHTVLGNLKAMDVVAVQEEIGISDFEQKCRTCPPQI